MALLGSEEEKRARSTGNLPLESMPKNGVSRITDCLHMTLAVDRGHTALA